MFARGLEDPAINKCESVWLVLGQRIMFVDYGLWAVIKRFRFKGYVVPGGEWKSEENQLSTSETHGYAYMLFA